MQAPTYDSVYPVGEETELLPRNITNTQSRKELIRHYLDHVTNEGGESYTWSITECINMDTFSSPDPRVIVLASVINPIIEIGGELILYKSDSGLYNFEIVASNGTPIVYQYTGMPGEFDSILLLFCNDSTTNVNGEHAFESESYPNSSVAQQPVPPVYNEDNVESEDSDIGLSDDDSIGDRWSDCDEY